MRPARHLARPAAARAGAALLALAAACSSDKATAPDPSASTFDVNQVLAGFAAAGGASTAALNVGALASPAASAAGLVGLGPPALTNCAWDAAAQAFACAAFTAGGLTTTVAYTPLDARGAPQQTPGRTTTAALRTVSTVNGTVTLAAADGGPGGTITVAARQEATIRGLLAGPRTLDGAMTMTSRAELGGGPAVRAQVAQTTAGLVLPEGGGRWPSAGTVTTDLLEPSTGAPVARTVMTFNGTSTVAVVVTSFGLTRRCALDLAAAGAAALSCPNG